MPSRKVGRFIVKVYTRNERGHHPHVHVEYGGGEVVILLGSTIEVRDNRGMKPKDVNDALEVVAEMHDTLVREWQRYNG